MVKARYRWKGGSNSPRNSQTIRVTRNGVTTERPLLDSEKRAIERVQKAEDFGIFKRRKQQKWKTVKYTGNSRVSRLAS